MYGVFPLLSIGALNGSNATLTDLYANLTRGKSPFITGIEFMGKVIASSAPPKPLHACCN